MADNDQIKIRAPKKDAEKQASDSSAAEQPIPGRFPLVIHGQYIKDLSFENPMAPHSLRGTGGPPELEVNFSMDAQKITFEDKQDVDTYEVTLGIQAVARRADKIAYIAEIEYATTCSAHDVPEENLHPMLLIEMPRMMFPFVRQLLASITQQAGFMPVMLAPVDFRAMYMQRYGEQMQAQNTEQGAKSDTESGADQAPQKEPVSA